MPTPAFDSRGAFIDRSIHRPITSWLAWVALMVSLTPFAALAEEEAPVAIPAWSAPEPPAELPPRDARLMEEARELHGLAVLGDDEAHDEAHKRFQRLLRRHPQHRRVMAWAGSSYLIKARETWWPPSKGKHAKRGVALLDQAVVQEPQDLTARWLRGVSTLPLPDRGGRRTDALADLNFVVFHARAGLEAEALTPRAAANAAFQLGNALEEDGDEAGAHRAWQQAIELAPQSGYAAQARAKLK